MVWKNWNNKIRISIITFILAIIVGPFVDFFENVPIINILLKPFFYFTYNIIGKLIPNLIDAAMSRQYSILIVFWILNALIYSLLGFLIGYFVDKHIK